MRWIAETRRLLDSPEDQERLRAGGRAAAAALTPERASEAYRSVLQPILEDR